MTSITQDFEPIEPTSNPIERAFAGRFRLNWETWIYILILVLAIFTRFYMLGARTMSHDESLHTKFSWDLYSNGNFAHTPLMHGPILFHITALDYFLFGDNDFTARIYPAVLGILMVMFPLLFRRWLGRWGAILASIMFLISPLIMYYNRYIREDTPSIFYTLVMVYCTFMYLNGPTHLRRKARWLYIFSAALLASMATKEVAFMYIAIFGSFLTLYWLVRMGQYFFNLPGKSVMYFLSVSILLGGVAALGMYVVLSISPLDAALQLGSGSIELSSIVRWTIMIAVAIAVFAGSTLIWAFRRSSARFPWVELLLMLALVVSSSAFFVLVEERSHLLQQDATQASAPVEPGQEGAVSTGSQYTALPLYAFIAVSVVSILILVYMKMAGFWNKLYRFPEFDVLLVMGTLVLPWLTPLVMKAMGASPMSMPQIAAAVQAAIPFIQFDLSQYGMQIILSAVPVIPAIAVGVVAGVLWNGKRWLISALVFYALFVFFFTTVFTNINGIGTGMIGSLGYWLEQQAVRRGNQPQYYYLLIIMPFYEFLPVIGSFLAMLTGLGIYWRHRRDRMEAQQAYFIAEMDGETSTEPAFDENGDPVSLDAMLHDAPVDGRKPKPRLLAADDKLKEVPYLLFVGWWAVFNLIAYTLAGEKMPWLGTHMTTPMIFLSGWYFGRFVQRIDAPAFWRRNWLYILLLPVLFVAGAQLVSPFLVGRGLGGLEQVQLTRTFQWFAGIIIGGAALYFVWRLIQRSGWAQARIMIGVMSFAFLSFLTFRSAWMASFINYDLATEFLVYAHGAPANKRVTEELQDLSERITGGMDLKFAYDNKISWPGAWYFRNFKNAVYMGETPSPRLLDDTAVVIVGDENRAAVEAILEDSYYKFDYPRLWWPMQDYFNLTPQRIQNTFDFSPDNTNAAQIRQGLFDIWWSRDYTTYGQALGRDFDITHWPVSDRMYVFIRKDIAAQIWDLGVGDGTAFSAGVQEVNVCNDNWQALAANLIIDTTGAQTLPLNRPRAVAVAANGQLYTAEEFNHRISVFNPDGTFAFSFGSEGAGPSQFERPNGVAIGPSGKIYVADTWNYRVQVFSPQGEYITGWGQRGEFGEAAQPQPFDGFWGPRAISVDAQERVYVADTGNKRIRVYTQDGQYIRDIGLFGTGVGQLDEPSGMAISPDGTVYIADTWNRRISVFTQDGLPVMNYLNAEGQQVNSFRVRGWFDDQGNRPYLALDTARNLLYVTDPDAGRVLVYDTAGNCVGSFGQLGRESLDTTQFASIGGIAVDAQGNVFVADAGGARILRFAAFSGVAAQPDVIVPPETTAEVIAPVGQESTAEILAPGNLESTAEVIAPPENTTEATPETTAGG